MSNISVFRAAALAAVLTIGGFAAAPATAGSHEKMMMEGGSANVGNLQLTGAWTRATPPAARAGGGYLMIKNTGSESDFLMAGSADFAKRVEIHEMAVVDDVMKMRHLADGLEVPAGKTVMLKPGGYHVMFMGLTEGLKQGAMVDVKLVFKKAGEVTVKMPVSAVGAKSLSGKSGAAMDHSKMHHGHDHDHANMSNKSQ